MTLLFFVMVVFALIPSGLDWAFSGVVLVSSLLEPLLPIQLLPQWPVPGGVVIYAVLAL